MNNNPRKIRDNLVHTVCPGVAIKPRLMRRVESGVEQQALVIGCPTCQSTRRQGRGRNLAWIIQPGHRLRRAGARDKGLHLEDMECWVNTTHGQRQGKSDITRVEGSFEMENGPMNQALSLWHRNLWGALLSGPP